MQLVNALGDHQTLLFSATIPPAIEKMAQTIMNDPVFVAVGSVCWISFLLFSFLYSLPFIPLSFLLSPLILPLLLLLLCLLFSFQPSTPTSAVKQTVLWVDNKIKKKKLFDLLEDPKYYHPPIVVFVDSKKGADMLAEAVTQVLGGEEGKVRRTRGGERDEV